MTVFDEQIENGDFVELNSRSEYVKYLDLVDKFCGYVTKWHTILIEGGDVEAPAIAKFLEKLCFTMKVLRLKCLFNRSHDLPLDLNESGFPNYRAFSDLETDLLRKNERLLTSLPEEMLKDQMVEHMFSKFEDPEDLLWQMADRRFLELIDEEKLFLTFTPGDLTLRNETKEYREYSFSWAYFDFATNMPACNLLVFHQDVAEERLELRGPAYNQFLSLIKAEGKRTPNVGVLASIIDTSLKAIHPKGLKRVRIGPVICPRFSREKNPEPLFELMKAFGGEDDFAVKILSEVVWSARQEKKQIPALDFGRSKKVREVFAIPSNDSRCSDSSASKVYDNLILPHDVLQQVVDDPRFAQYLKMGHIAYSKKGDLYVV